MEYMKPFIERRAIIRQLINEMLPFVSRLTAANALIKKVRDEKSLRTGFFVSSRSN